MNNQNSTPRDHTVTPPRHARGQHILEQRERAQAAIEALQARLNTLSEVLGNYGQDGEQQVDDGVDEQLDAKAEGLAEEIDTAMRDLGQEITLPADERLFPFEFPRFLPKQDYDQNAGLCDIPQFWASPQYHFASSAKGAQTFTDHCQMGAELAAHYIQLAASSHAHPRHDLLRQELLPLVMAAPMGIAIGFLTSIERLLVELVPEPFEAIETRLREEHEEMVAEYGEREPSPANLEKASFHGSDRPLPDAPVDMLRQAREALGYVVKDVNSDSQLKRAELLLNAALAKLEQGRPDVDSTQLQKLKDANLRAWSVVRMVADDECAIVDRCREEAWHALLGAAEDINQVGGFLRESIATS